MADELDSLGLSPEELQQLRDAGALSTPKPAAAADDDEEATLRRVLEESQHVGPPRAPIASEDDAALQAALRASEAEAAAHKARLAQAAT